MFKIQLSSRILSCLICLFSMTQSYAYTPAILDLIRDNQERGNYLGVLQQLYDNCPSETQAQLESSFYYSLLADYETFLGLQYRALKHDDKTGRGSPTTQQTPQNELNLSDYELKDARVRIATVAKNRSVIFINEAHHSPRHRAFTLSLLQDLYNQGFHYFAAETFSEADVDVNQRGYPLSLMKSGYYTDEPIYGELLREAHKIGYKIIPYEDYSTCDPFHDEANTCINIREKGQAKNLYERIFKLDPNAKLLVHAGYGHIAKQVSKDGFTTMAVYFKQFTGIEPYSIDQTIMSEHGGTAYENTLYKQLIESRSIKENSVLVDKTDLDWRPLEQENPYDLIVFQPRTIYKHNRPAWLFEIEKRKPFFLSADVCQNDFPCVIEAFREEEGVDSVPIDRFVIYKAHSIHLALMQGMYIIRAKNKLGDILTVQNGVVS